MEDKQCPNCGLWNFGTALKCDCGYDFSSGLMDESYGKALSLSTTWGNALIKPSVSTFKEIASDPNASSGRAYTWVFISALIGSTLSMFIGSLFGTGMLGAAGETSAIGTMVFGVLIAAIVSVISIMISAGITQLIASALGGTGTYSKLVYAFAAYLAPLTLITSVVSIIPIVNCLAILLGIYGIVLNVIAVKAVNQFEWGKAIISSILIVALLLVLVAVIVIVILALLGPAIGNVFSNITEGILTPVP